MDDWSQLPNRNAVSEPEPTPTTTLNRYLTQAAPSWMDDKPLPISATQQSHSTVHASSTCPLADAAAQEHAVYRDEEEEEEGSAGGPGRYGCLGVSVVAIAQSSRTGFPISRMRSSSASVGVPEAALGTNGQGRAAANRASGEACLPLRKPGFRCAGTAHATWRSTSPRTAIRTSPQSFLRRSPLGLPSRLAYGVGNGISAIGVRA